VGHERNVLNRLAPIRRALHEELAVLVLHVLDGGLQKMGGDHLRLVPDLAHRECKGGTADGRRATSVGAPAHRRRVGVAVDDLHVARVDADLARDDLRKRRFLALSVRRRSDEDVGFAGRVHPDDGAFP
jgi:hypothetical protein